MLPADWIVDASCPKPKALRLLAAIATSDMSY